MKLLKKLREEKGLTQRNLGRLSYCSHTTISNAEIREANTSLSILESIAKVLNWDGDPKELLEEVDE